MRIPSKSHGSRWEGESQVTPVGRVASTCSGGTPVGANDGRRRPGRAEEGRTEGEGLGG